MIPILYESTEKDFKSNGIHRLRDCLRCEVTEERNGIYELELDYPVDGAYFEEIAPGRIIVAEHDKTGDVQPFDIYRHSKPINKIVTFYARHVSYRTKGLTMASYPSSITDLSQIFLYLYMVDGNEFMYDTNVTANGTASCLKSLPLTVREILGGVEGSVLDAFGGEYEWDKFVIYLHKARGIDTDYTVRYGLNMTDYNDDCDYSDSYFSCIPFWRGTDANNQEVTVIGSEVQSFYESYDRHKHCIPLDLTDKFESQPTTNDLESAAFSYMLSNQSHLPRQTIKVNFIMLEDTEELKNFANLQELSLCDTIKVEFPLYGMSGKYKIVKVVWDVLGERYLEMELGTLSISLAQALGIKR